MKKFIPWDLTDVYTTKESVEIDIKKLKNDAAKFVKKYRNQIIGLNFDKFHDCVCEYEQILQIGMKMECYSELLETVNLNQPEILAFSQNLTNKMTDIFSDLVFFDLEIALLPARHFKRFCHRLTPGQISYLKKIRAAKDYLQSEEVEKLLLKRTFHVNAWTKLYSETCAGIKYKIHRHVYNEAEALELTCNESEQMRHDAGREINNQFKAHASVVTACLNSIMKDKLAEDELRGYKTPVSAMNLENQVDDADVEALTNAAVRHYQTLSHHYYELKANCLGRENISYWDRNAPYGIVSKKKYSWDKTKKIVSDAYKAFSPEFNDIAQNFFTNDWIDVYPRDGKTGGCYCMPMPADIHPYLLLNHTQSLSDVLAVAHEVGHGIHESLSKAQGQMGADKPIVLAELASVFAENLVFQNLLHQERNPLQRFELISQKVEELLGISIRQIAFHKFETRLYAERAEGELTSERICEIWVEEMSASLGKVVDMEDAEYSWVCVSHFFESPFYVYGYSFSYCLVISLFELYQEGNITGFAEKYMQLLKDGGIKTYAEALAEFGIDVKAPDFWDKGLNYIESMIKELEKIRYLLEE